MLKLSSLFDDLYETQSDGISVFRFLIDGKWVKSSSGKTFDVRCPADGSLVARVQNASIQDVEAAISAAHAARQKIREIPGIQRIEIFERARELLLEHEEEFVHVLSNEAGKPRREGKGEIEGTSNRLKLTMEEARKIFGEYLPGDWSEDTLSKIALVIREPIGVITCISPFNYPLYIASSKIIPALLAGNTVVAKNSSAVPISLLLFGRILSEAGMPKGSINVITGKGKDVGDALVTDQRVGMITFTGGTDVGKRIVSIAGLKKLHLELGGKAVAIVLEDADILLAAKKIVEGSLKNCGQRCDAISVVLAVDSIADRLTKELANEAQKWTTGDPRTEDVRVGPLINEEASKTVDGMVQDAVRRGAKLVLGGTRTGSYYTPAVLDRVPKDAVVAQEETFGPVIPVVRVKDTDEAISISRGLKYGLDSCVFTNNFYNMWKVAKRLEAGMISINDFPRHGVGFFPFGGVKDSGMGREGIGYSIDEMTNLKTVVFNLEPGGMGKAKKASMSS